LKSYYQIKKKYKHNLQLSTYHPGRSHKSLSILYEQSAIEHNSN